MFPHTSKAVDNFPHTSVFVDMFPNTNDINAIVPIHVETVVLMSKADK